MKTLSDNHIIDVPCRCGQTIKESLERLKDNPRLICPKCRAAIMVNDKQLQKITDNLQKKIPLHSE